MRKPKELWAFWANRRGPWWKKPQRVMESPSGGYYHSNGNADVLGEGLEDRGDGYLAFAHRDKKEVQKFIDGFMSCRRLMAGFYVD